MGKPKYNPDDVERWVTVRGARIPIMKDGSFGIGTKDGVTRKDVEELTAKKDSLKGVELNAKPITQEEVNQWEQNNPFKQESKNAKYDTSRVGKKKPTSLEAFKENSNQMINALKEGQRQNALEVHYTDMTGKTYKHYWNGVKFTTDKVKQDMAKKYGKKSGVYKASFKKPSDWE